MAHLKLIAAAAALACLAVPATAQDEPEEPRTTYQITYLKLKPGSDERWLEMMNEHVLPVDRAAGLPEPVIHLPMSGPWDLIILREVPGGMAELDSHNPPSRVAFRDAFLAHAGSEEAAEKLNEEMDGLIADSQRLFTHTHP